MPQSLIGATLAELRTRACTTQGEVAQQVNQRAGQHGGGVTANTVSKWERGLIRPGPRYLRILADIFGVAVDDIHLPARAGTPVLEWKGRYVVDEPDARVARSHDEWCRSRTALNANRPALTGVAATVHGQASRLGATGLLAAPGWIPARPMPLDGIKLALDPVAPEPDLDGTERETAPVRPLATVVRPYPRYTQAIRDLSHPRLFENRASWRLTDVDLDNHMLTFGPTTYFASIDVCEALAHELAVVQVDDDGMLRPTRPALRNLPFRQLVGDPFDLQRRPVPVAVDTLTIRRDDRGATFVLHQRDSASVAVAGGSLSVIPSGVFQPSSVATAAQDADFDLWRNMMREYSEELLGNPEHDGDGAAVRYDRAPFAAFDEGRRLGTIRPYFLGVALDALTLFGEVLTAAVFDAPIYDMLFADAVNVNEEGTVLASAEFIEPVIADLLGSGRLSGQGAGCLLLAWQHRDVLLAAPS
jgi:transcriptional regulator with XRE-family HTH domain